MYRSYDITNPGNCVIDWVFFKHIQRQIRGPSLEVYRSYDITSGPNLSSFGFNYLNFPLHKFPYFLSC